MSLGHENALIVVAEYDEKFVVIYTNGSNKVINA